jgi:AcrR family transcriptional regulator
MTKTKLGRPPDSSSDATRARILDAARRCFAELGYEGATNKHLASAAGLTTGAIYHYFGSKKELYCDVQEAVQGIVYDRFAVATEAAGPTFSDKIVAVLDTAVELNREDPSLAAFLVTVRTDIPRHAELRDEVRLRPVVRRRFFSGLIRLGIETGEIDPADERAAFDVISAMMMGLVSASSGDPEVHERAVDGVKRLLLGTFVRPPRT